MFVQNGPKAVAFIYYEAENEQMEKKEKTGGDEIGSIGFWCHASRNKIYWKDEARGYHVKMSECGRIATYPGEMWTHKHHFGVPTLKRSRFAGKPLIRVKNR